MKWPPNRRSSAPCLMPHSEVTVDDFAPIKSNEILCTFAANVDQNV